jgi:HNH endonuclease
MRLDFCAVCGRRDSLEHHHFIPRASGGSDDEQNMLTLCGACHMTLHDMRSSRRLNHAELTSAGIAAKVARDGQWDRKSKHHLVPGAGHAAAAAARKATADQAARDLAPIIADIRKHGASSLRQIAAGLTGRNIPMPKGGA